MTYSLYGYADRKPKHEIMRGIDHVRSKIIARNTVWFEQPDGRIGVRFHNCTILEQVDGGWNLFYGGWPTSTTADRINLALRLYVNPKFNVWRVGKQGQHDIYLRTESQMVPISTGLFLPEDGDLEERSGSQDYVLRSYLWWSSNRGTTANPMHVEWDGRASTLRYMMVGYSKSIIPYRFAQNVPGLRMKGFIYNWGKKEMHWKIVKRKIRFRNLFDDVLAAGHIDNIRRST